MDETDELVGKSHAELAEYYYNKARLSVRPPVTKPSEPPVVKHERVDRAKLTMNRFRLTRLSGILNQCKNRAIIKDIEFSLTYEWFKEKAIKIGRCEVTGIQFDHSKPKVRGKSNPFGPSIDRVNPNLGYTPDNCRVVVWIHNRAKGDDDMGVVYHYCKALVKAIEGE